MLNSSGDLAIAELAFYVLALPVAIIVGNKHGYGRSAGWYFLIALSVVRIVGGVLEIVSEEITKPPKGLIIAASTLENVGVSPLLLATLALLKRVHTDMHKASVDARVFWVIGLLPTVALILSIVSATKLGSTNKSNVQAGESELEAGAGLLFGGVVLTILLALYLWKQYKQIHAQDRRLFLAVLVTLPLLFVRALYSILAAFNFGNPSSVFNRFTGSIWVQVGMGVIEEFAIVIIYLATGYIAPVMPKKESDAEQVGSKQGKGRSSIRYLLMPNHSERAPSPSEQAGAGEPGHGLPQYRYGA